MSRSLPTEGRQTSASDHFVRASRLYDPATRERQSAGYAALEAAAVEGGQ